MLEKTRLLAEFFRGLPSNDLPAAVQFFTGAPLAANSGKTLQVGWAQLQGAALAMTGATAEDYGREFLRWSDVGDTLAALWPENPDGGGMELHELAHWFDQIAAEAPGTEKAAKVARLFQRLNADEARYVSKIIVGELRIGLREGLVEDGVARAFEVKPAEIRRAHQLLGDLAKVALAARAGTLDNLAISLFSPIKPMLASPETAAEVIAQRMGEEVWLEDKLDGIRAQAHRGPGKALLFSRDSKDVTQAFPEVVAALEALPGELILDGEVMAHREGVALPFFDLQKRLGRKTLTAAMLERTPVAYFAFDILYQDGEPLLDHPLHERRARLDALPELPGFYRLPYRRVSIDTLAEEFTAAKARANEGLMVKHPESTYSPGRRGLTWLKYKRALDPLDVVVTGVEYGHGRRRDVLSDYTFAVRNDATGELVNIGKAYSGLTDAEILELTEYFRANTLQSFGRFQSVKPELEIEVAFEAIQESARHKSGFALRFPRILRVRSDKTPADINTLADVRRQYEQYRAVYGGVPEAGGGASIP